MALFGPTGVGKTQVALELADGLRDAGRSPVAVSADALQVYAGLEILTGAATAAERARLEHRLVSFLPVDATFSVGQYAELAHAEIDAILAAGADPARRRRHRAVPARGARRAHAASASAGRGPRALGGGARRARAAGAARAADAACVMGRGRHRPRRPPSHHARARAARPRRAGAAGGPEPALDGGHAPPDAPDRARLRARGALRADRRTRGPDAGRRRRRRGARRSGRRGVGDRAPGARLRGAAGRRRGRDETPHAQLRQAPADVDAQARGRRAASTSRSAQPPTWRARSSA